MSTSEEADATLRAHGPRHVVDHGHHAHLPHPHLPHPDLHGAMHDLRPGEVIGTARDVRGFVRSLGRRRVLLSAIALAFAGLVAIGAMSGASMWWTSKPSFCASCHPMRKFVDAWQVSKHKTVNCERCHAPSGTFGFVGGKIASLQVVSNYLRGRYDDTSFNAAVPNQACESCHHKVLDRPIVRNGIKVDHKTIVTAGGKCMFCHSAIAHGNAVPVGSRTGPTMGACFKCHDGHTAPTRCSLCHVGPRSRRQAATQPRPTAADAVRQGRP